MEDVKGTHIRQGDRVAFSTRVGDHAVLKVGEVVGLRPGSREPGVYGAERDDRITVQVDGQARPSTVNVRSVFGPKVAIL